MAKLTTLIILISFLQISAKSYSQLGKFDLKLKNVTILEVFENIEDISNYRFFYDNEQIDLTKKVSIDTQNGALVDILKDLFADTELTWEVKDRLILLHSKNTDTNSGTVLQKQSSVKGTVTDEAGLSLPGVTVVVKGTTQGVVTDMNGKYTISNIPDGTTLQFSFVGRLTREIIVSGQTTIDVKLVMDVIGIEEVVAVGYGTLRKSDITGTVSTLNSDKLRETSAVNVAQAMAGQIAGVQVQQTNGAPGGANIMVRVRGAGSITAGNTPLFVIDGYPMDNGDLSMINPNNIESIQILKDASASAIYGSRGGNGVVLITTKTGGKGQNVELNISSGIQQVAHRPEMMDSYEYAEWFIDSHNNAYLQAFPAGNITDTNAQRAARNSSRNYQIPDAMYHPETLPNTNWGDVIFRNALIQNYQINVSNSTEKGRSLFGGSYVSQEGTIVGSDFEQFNLHSNFLSNVTKKLSFGGNLDASYNKSNKVEDGKYGPVELSIVVPPIYPVYNADGSYGAPTNSKLWSGDDPSPLETALENDFYEKQYRTIGKIFGEYQITPALSYKVSLGGVMRINKEFRYRPSYMNRDSKPAPNLADGWEESSYGFNWLFENLLNYEKKFGTDHELKGLLGYTVQKNMIDESRIYATNYPNDVVHTLSA